MWLIKLSINYTIKIYVSVFISSRINSIKVLFVKKIQNIFVFANVMQVVLELGICTRLFRIGMGFMVFNATFNNISVILLRSILLVEETRVPGENNRPVTSQ
jgi:hypothetical protein